ncbi:VHS domain-containing protein [Butyriboletus roseoflavus]|nr:VHS domain-containing protein [Butyriboletus roseoflavus]
MLPQTTPWFKVSRLEVLITNACDPSLPEPNYAHHLEIADFINTKKANTPREAVMMVARLANHRNHHIAILALALLDTLVQSCGYPLHLQVATKEFLNELVRRFPERPPPFPGPVMSRILDLIHSWKEGICADSRWKEDLGNIRDMHRLLTFKGYRFRDLHRQDLSDNTMTIKTPEELENEDREAQSAKLQELIRRGTPRDLIAAQELMKTLAGANPDAKPDYRSQSLSELAKLQSKVVLLNEMLDNVDTAKGEHWARGDVYDQVATILMGARPKLQKWVSDAEADDPESLNAFLEANDQINTVLARFEAFQAGDFAAVASIPTTIASGSGADGYGTSLIDFDDGSADVSNGSTSGNTNPVDDLMNLFSQQPSQQPPPINTTTRPSLISSPYPTTVQSPPQFGSIMLPGTPTPSNGSSNGSTGRTTSPPANFGPGSSSPGLSIDSRIQPQSQTVPALGSAQFTSMMQQKPQNQFLGSGVGVSAAGGPRSSSLGAAIPPSGPATPPGLGGFHSQTVGATARQRAQTQPTTAQNKDPFADLAGLF